MTFMHQLSLVFSVWLLLLSYVALASATTETDSAAPTLLPAFRLHACQLLPAAYRSALLSSPDVDSLKQF